VLLAGAVALLAFAICKCRDRARKLAAKEMAQEYMGSLPAMNGV
jgi:hypothetical protein